MRKLQYYKPISKSLLVAVLCASKSIKVIIHLAKDIVFTAIFRKTSLKLHLDYDREQMEDFGQT